MIVGQQVVCWRVRTAGRTFPCRHRARRVPARDRRQAGRRGNLILAGKGFPLPRTCAWAALMTVKTGRDLIPLTAAAPRPPCTPRVTRPGGSASTGHTGDAAARPAPRNPLCPQDRGSRQVRLSGKATTSSARQAGLRAALRAMAATIWAAVSSGHARKPVPERPACRTRQGTGSRNCPLGGPPVIN